MLAREMGMLKLGLISVDDSKMKANASKHRALSWGHSQKIRKQLQEEVKQSMTLAGLEDRKNLPNELEVPKKKLSTNSRKDNVASSSHELEESG